MSRTTYALAFASLLHAAPTHPHTPSPTIGTKRMNDFSIPADVPSAMQNTYQENYDAITRGTGRLFLYACDQKVEHLNDDFYGEDISEDALAPEHLFRIARDGDAGAMAAHLGFIARYGADFPDINYIVKVNAKTHLVTASIKEPFSKQLWSVADVIQFKKDSGLNIRGVGITLYAGSMYEDDMLYQTAQTIYQAHQQGLIVVVWIYPRGKAIKSDTDPRLVAGICGLANALGADFVKVKAPHATSDASVAQSLTVATSAAGNTGVICSGGAAKDPEQFLAELYEQLKNGVRGCATGRNIFQKSLPDAVAMTKAIAALVYRDADAQGAWQIYQEKSA